MSPPKIKPRASILKKRLSTAFDVENEATSTTTFAKLPRKGINFSEKNTVKEFQQCDERTTIWGNSYELSIAKSSSSDGSQSSKKLNFDFTSSVFLASTLTAPTLPEMDKENVQADEIPIEPRRTNSLSSSGSINVDNLTVDLNIDEKKRIKKYGMDNLNITNMQLEEPIEKEVRMVLSPRKTIGHNRASNFSVSIYEKTLTRKTSDPAENTLLDDLSIRLEEDENVAPRSIRKTILKPEDMNITEVESSMQISKSPVVRRPFKFPLHQVARESSMQFDSPPIKAPAVPHDDSNMYLDFFVAETPTKDLCAKMCDSRKHGITPIQDPPAKVVYSSSKLTWGKKLTTPRPASPEFELSIPETQLEADNLSIDIQPGRATRFHSETINETLTEIKFLSSGRSTIYNHSMALDRDSVSASNSEMNLAAKENVEPHLQANFEQLRDADIDEMDIEEPTPRQKVLPKLASATGSSSKVKSSRVTQHQSEEIDETFENIVTAPQPDFGLSTPKTQLEADNLSIDIQPGRATRFHSETINETLTEIKFLPSGRSTVYNHSMALDRDSVSALNPEMNLAAKENVEPHLQANFEQLRDADIDEMDILPKLASATGSSSKVKSSRVTQHQSEEIDETFENIVRAPQPASPDFGLSIPKTQLEVDNLSIDIQPGRATQFKSETLAGINEVKCHPRGRSTIYNHSMALDRDSVSASNSEMNLAAKENVEPPLQANFEQPRDAAIDDMDIEHTTTGQKVLPKPATCSSVYNESKARRVTQHQSEEIDETLIEHRTVSEATTGRAAFNTRDIYTDSPVQPVKDVVVDADEPLYESPREAVFDLDIDETVAGTKSVTLVKLKNLPAPTTVPMHLTVHESNDISLTCNYAPSGKSMNLTSVSDAGILETTKELAGTVARLLENPMANTNSTSNLFTKSYQHENIQEFSDMSGVEAYEKMEEIKICDSRRTFTVDRDDSRRLMEITSADIDSMIVDESIPTMSEFSDERHANARSATVNDSHVLLSYGSNASYQDAIRQYVNMTLNLSEMEEHLEEQTPDVDRVIELPEDFCAKLGSLVDKIQKPEMPLPKFEIEEYLERLNIKPIKFKKHPHFEPGYFERRAAERQERLRHAAEQRKAVKENQYLPAIPSYSFLIDNLIAISEERIAAKGSSFDITPMFPEDRDFDSLLENKIKTDENLSTFWNLDLTFAFMRHYKFSHKKMDAFKINITVCKSAERSSINSSTIPIQFEHVLMYTNPNYRGKLSERLKTLMKEFKNAMGTDKFLHMCSSINQLFDFLNYYHEKVLQAANLVDNYYKIIDQNNAITERDSEQRMDYIFKRIFTNEDIIDLKIAQYGQIEKISVHCIGIRGLRRNYELQPRPHIANLEGLMFIETVLFDAEKFLHDNTICTQKE